MKNETSGRNGTVDMFRLLYSLVVMTGHAVTVGVTSPFPFEGVGILVEFFLFLSGFMTYTHFQKRNDLNKGEYFFYSLRYTWKKFKVFFPYVCVSVGISHGIRLIAAVKNVRGGGEIANISYHMISEAFLLNYVFAEIGLPSVGPLYYLAALLFVFPLFCLFCQFLPKSIQFAIAVYAMLFYYRDINTVMTATYPFVLLRVFCGLCTGIVIYYAVQTLREKKWMKDKWATVAAIALLSTPLILSGFHMSGTMGRRSSLICEFFGLIVAMSNALLGAKHNKVTDYFGKLSLVIYIIHGAIGMNIGSYLAQANLGFRLILYYMVTFSLSVLLIMAVDRWGIRSGKLKNV